MTIQIENKLLSFEYDTSRFASLFDSLDIAESTRKDYILRLPSIIEFIRKMGFDRDTYLRYKRYLSARHDLSVSTKNKYLTVARILLREMHRREYLPVDITVGIKLFKDSRKHKKHGLSDEEVERLCGHLKQLETTPVNLRLKAIMSMLIFQGFRQIEIVRLDVTDIDLVDKNAMIIGKGSDGKQRIDLHPHTVTAINDYLKSSGIKTGALFTSQSNRSRNERLSTRSLRKIVIHSFKKIGIDRTVHGTRHYFVTRLIKTYKSDLTAVMDYTRHRSLSTLQVYNDAVRQKADLPRYYRTFQNVNF